MHVLHIGKFYPPFHGGMESWLFDLANEQVKQGMKVTVLVHNHNWGMLKSPTISNLENDIKLIRQQTWRPVFHTPLMRGINKQINQIIATDPPNLIHLHWPNPSLFYLLLNSRAKRIPWVVSWHADMVTENSSWLMRLIYRIIRPLETRVLKQCKSIVVSSQAYLNHSKPLLANAHKVSVIPLGISVHQLKQFQPDEDFINTSWQTNQFRLFNLGRLTYYKNQQMLIHAMKSLADCQLIIAGDGKLAAPLAKLTASLRVSNEVKLIGKQSWQHIHSLFASCDVFCLASHDRAESFGVVLLEAMYHNKIILVADTPGSGMQWLAKNYNKGFVFIANNESDYVDKIRYIQNNYVSIMQRPYQFNYNINQIAKLISEHYDKNINNTGVKNEINA